MLKRSLFLASFASLSSPESRAHRDRKRVERQGPQSLTCTDLPIPLTVEHLACQCGPLRWNPTRAPWGGRTVRGRQ